MQPVQPLILIVNDDGIFSPGLKAAAEAVADLGELLIAAPRYQQTSMGRALPTGPDVGKIEAVALSLNGEQRTAYAVYGSPAQAVQHAVLELAPRKPALCISGINYGENLGYGITISGTVGAALEAGAMRIPGLAVSVETDMSVHHSSEYGEVDWRTAAYFTRYCAERILRNSLPPEVVALNVNVPATATSQTPIRATIQSRISYYVPHPGNGARDFSQGARLGYRANQEGWTGLEPDSDIRAFLNERVVSVTPLGWELTARLPLAEWYQEFVR